MEILSTPSESEKTYAIIMNVSLLFFFIVPIVLWIIRHDDSKFIDAYGKIITNWIISSVIYTIIGGILCLVLIGFAMLWALGICSVIFAIIGAVKASKGEVWKYPFSFEVFR